MRDLERRDGPFLEASDLSSMRRSFSAARSAGRTCRLFRIYAEGNFIEAGTEHDYLPDR